MLVRASFQNILSFNGPVELSLAATRQRLHSDHVVSTTVPGRPKLLRAALIYGANASGKSNLIRCFATLRQLVVQGVSPDAPIPVDPFLLDSRNVDHPSTFEVEFRVEDDYFRYRLSASQRRIEEESLDRVGRTSDETMFSRSHSQSDSAPKVTFSKKAPDRQFLEFVAKGTRPNQPFLAESVQRNVEWFRPAFEWFKDTVVVLGPRSRHMTLELRADTDQHFREFLAQSLAAADTGISSLDPQTTTLEECTDLSPADVSKVRSELVPGKGVLVHTSNGSRLLAHLSDGVAKAIRLRLQHRSGDGKGAFFEFSQESEGTQRFIDLIPMLYDINSGSHPRVYLVDEMERSLHPRLSRMLLSEHLSPSNRNKQSQIILATHATELLDLELLRRDEIWLIEKDAVGASHLIALTDYKPRHDKEIRQAYLLGRYGGIPSLRRLPNSSVMAESRPATPGTRD